MAKQNDKKRPKRRKRPTQAPDGAVNKKLEKRRRRAAALEAGLLGKSRKTREDRHILVALTMASLVAGLLFVINFDRSTNGVAASEMGKGASLHGWPFIYLQREFESLPAYLKGPRDVEWAIPVVKGETRTMNYQNLGWNFLVCSICVVLSFIVVRSIVYRYDQWKKTWT